MYRPKMRQLGWCFVALISYINISLASNWDITPAFLVAQHYTDNLFLVGDKFKKEDYVTEINPAIAISAEAKRLDLNFNYVMQNLFYRYNNDYNDTNNLLQLKATSELLKNNLFFDVAGRIDQQTVSVNQSIPVDNINIGNRTEVRALSLSPYFLSDMSGNMDTNVRYSHGTTKIEEGASDSTTDSVGINLASGRHFDRFTWTISYDNVNEEREHGDTIKFENGFANARYRLFNRLSFLANYGYANNDYQTTETVNNGSYWAFGLGWRPNTKFRIDAVYGSEYRSATVDWDPTPHTSLTASWHDTDIGLNPGKTWSGRFLLRSKRTQWAARYLEDTTTTQQIQVLPDPISPQEDAGKNLQQGSSFGFGVTNEVFIRRRGQFTVNYTRKKSKLFFSYFNETRDFQTSGAEQQTNGGSGSWNWNISGKTSFNILLRTEKRLIQLGEPQDNYQLAETSIEWKLKRPFSASATYRYINSDSEEETRSYEENRLILRINAVFSNSEKQRQTNIK